MIHCLIVDHERMALRMLRRVCQKLQEVRIVGVCTDAESTKSWMNDHPVDLMIVNPNLPKVNEIQSLKDRPEIFYSKLTDELTQSGQTSQVLHLKELRKLLAKMAMEDRLGQELNESDYMLVKSDGKFVYIDLNELRYVKSLRDYVIFKLPNKRYVVHSTLKNIEAQLADFDQFFKVHRSYIVNMDHVDTFTGTQLILNDLEVPVSRSYRKQVKCYLEDPQCRIKPRVEATYWIK